ncbi:MAG TPA: PIG-L deacetylase family protein [Dehalococcoidia bacterium]|nr:PIG-L deacetylase family protein [Dehalococcoidia bacterium]
MRTIMVVAAHPDDPEFGVAGCVARWTEQGDQVYFVICTNGDKGSGDPDMTSERLAGIREKEELAAAQMLGVKEVLFLRHPDGDLDYTRELRGEVVRAIRKFRPDVIITSDPYRKYFWHHDHRICGQVVLDAVYPYARDRLSYPEQLKEGLTPHAVKELLLWGSDEPDTFFDITDKFDQKIAALKCHHSQVGRHAEKDLREWVETRAREAGQKIGVQYAEQFHRVVIPM